MGSLCRVRWSASTNGRSWWRGDLGRRSAAARSAAAVGAGSAHRSAVGSARDFAVGSSNTAAQRVVADGSVCGGSGQRGSQRGHGRAAGDLAVANSRHGGGVCGVVVHASRWRRRRSRRRRRRRRRRWRRTAAVCADSTHRSGAGSARDLAVGSSNRAALSVGAHGSVCGGSGQRGSQRGHGRAAGDLAIANSRHGGGVTGVIVHTRRWRRRRRRRRAGGVCPRGTIADAAERVRGAGARGLAGDGVADRADRRHLSCGGGGRP
eukprot:COSAG01_NODE_764_length_13766_cov_1901.849638_3_plen_264_part_00